MVHSILQGASVVKREIVTCGIMGSLVSVPQSPARRRVRRPYGTRVFFGRFPSRHCRAIDCFVPNESRKNPKSLEGLRNR